MNIVYIDDSPDLFISRYMAEMLIKSQPVSGVEKIEFNEIIFDDDENFEDLLKNKKVIEANILIVDERLFEEQSERKKFTGLQFRLILKKVYPFKEVIVITQPNNLDTQNRDDIVYKYSGKDGREAATKHYENCLKPAIVKATNNYNESATLIHQLIDSYRQTGDEVPAIFEKMSNSLFDNDYSYQDFRKSDIDKLIKSFNCLERTIHEGLQNK